MIAKEDLPPHPNPNSDEYLGPTQTPDSGKVPKKEASKPRSVKHCIYHNSASHEITECKAFNNMSAGEREDWIFEERLCFCCLSPDHVASVCKKSIKRSICGRERHSDFLHLSREEKKERAAKDRNTRRESAKRKPQMYLSMQRRYGRTLMQQDRAGGHL